MKYFFWGLVLVIGCAGPSGNDGLLKSFPAPLQETEWIVNGEPIEFQSEQWYPQDDFEVLLDPEMTPAGHYREVEFFVEKIDVKPYSRIYTKFGRNKFRYFEKRPPGE